MIFAPLEQFNILFIFCLKIFYFDFFITNFLFINFLSLFIILSIVFLNSYSKKFEKTKLFYFVCTSWQKTIEFFSIIVAQLMTDIITKYAETFFLFIFIILNFIFFSEFVELITNLYFLVGLLNTNKVKIPKELEQIGIYLYFFKLEFEGISITISIIIKQRKLVNASDAPNNDDALMFEKVDGSYKLIDYKSVHFPENPKKIRCFEKDFEAVYSRTEEPVYIETFFERSRKAIYKVEQKDLNLLVNTPEVIKKHVEKLQDGDYLYFSAYDLLAYDIFILVSVNNIFIDIGKFYNISLGFLIRKAADNPNFNSDDFYIWFTGYHTSFYYRVHFCLKQVPWTLDMTSVKDFINLIKKTHLTKFDAELPSSSINKEFKKKNSLIRMALLKIKQENKQFTISLFREKLYNICKYKKIKKK